MAKQLIFKSRYVQRLKKDLVSGGTLELYYGNNFVYDEKEVLTLPNIEFDPDLSNRLDVNDDFETARELYKAFEKLEPIQASDERLWVYLSHVDLYLYMTKRWSDLRKSANPSKYISDHWFLESSTQSSLLRNSLSGLWWSVYLSADNSRGENNKYDLTKILFRQLDFPTRTLGTYKLGRHKEAVIGILEFIQENEELFKTKFEDKTRFITKYLNIIGGVKPISYYDRYFFKSELQKVYGSISSL